MTVVRDPGFLHYRIGTFIAGPKGERQVTANELEVAKAQGRHVAGIATKLAAK